MLTSAPADSGQVYLITEAAEKAGTHAATIRAWERRYHWPIPTRTRTGFRVYDAATVALLAIVVSQTRAGRPIGDIMRDGKPCIAPAAPRRIPAASCANAAVPAGIVSRDGRDLARDILRMIGFGLSEMVVRRNAAAIWSRVHPRERGALAALITEHFPQPGNTAHQGT